ncbi:MAG: TPM domain-containing protein [Flavobacteriales bacterium]|nr:TPM domain-containing protein [Flavobacteriales bacterium]
MKFCLPPRFSKFFLFTAAIWAWIQAAAAQNIPAFSGQRVLDAAGILSSATLHYLENLLKQHEDSTSNQVMVLTVQSLEGFDIETYANKAFRQYRLGQEGKDNGVLLLVAVQERQVRIETGYGLEGALPDALAGRIIDHEILPAFREGNYDTGILQGVQAILMAIRGEYVAEPKLKPVNFWLIFGIILLLIVVGSIFGSSSHHVPRSGGWWLPGGGYRYTGGGGFRGGGFSGGGFLGGGGSSGGGGASGRW